jgi:hypothetical protein
MNICCSGVKIILIDNILRTKLLRQLMTFLTVQLLFDKLRHTLLFCRTYLTRNFLKYTVQCKQRYIRTSKCYRSGFKIIFSISKASNFFFFNAIPVFCHTAFTVPFSVGGFSFFQFHFTYPLLPSGGATGLRGTFPGNPRPFHLFPTGLEPVLTSRWWPKEC